MTDTMLTHNTSVTHHAHHHSQVSALVESLKVTVENNLMTLKIRTLLTNYR